jgi:hypothetical protein
MCCLDLRLLVNHGRSVSVSRKSWVEIGPLPLLLPEDEEAVQKRRRKLTLRACARHGSHIYSRSKRIDERLRDCARPIARMAYRVFLSSTSKDLAAYREAVHRALDALDGFDLIGMESFGARDTDARGIDEQKLREADLLVGLMGHCYGSSPPDDPTSFTEQEYDFAVDRKLPRLMFVAPDEFPVPQHLIEPDDKRARQKAFRERVMVDRVVASFATPEGLAARVTQALANWRVERITAELVAAKEAEAKRKEEAAKYREEATREAARRAELERTLAEDREERKALRAAVQALADRAGAPEAPPGVEQALALLPEGRTAEAKAVFEEIVARKQAEGAASLRKGAGALREAVAAAHHLVALASLDGTLQAILATHTGERLHVFLEELDRFLGRLPLQAGSSPPPKGG